MLSYATERTFCDNLKSEIIFSFLEGWNSLDSRFRSFLSSLPSDIGCGCDCSSESTALCASDTEFCLVC